MGTHWQEKNIGFLSRKGTSERRSVLDDRDGTPAGHETEHWDDHQDAVAIAKPVRVKARRRDPR